MGHRFRARQKDASHRAVVAAFRALGCSVLVIEEAEKGAPDLIVGVAGQDHGVEVKPTRAQALRKDQTTPRASQQAFHERWRGAPIQVARTIEDAAALVALWRRPASYKPDPEQPPPGWGGAA